MSNKKSTAVCSANFIVISFVPILFFVAMILGYLHLIPLHVPIYSLGVIGFILFVFLLFIKHNANYSICKMKLSLYQLEDDLKKELKQSALTINEETKSVLEIDTYLQRYYAEVRNDNFVSIASSVFPMMGILGTFVAIAISMPNFSVADTEALDREISLLLSGIGSAFFASIYGILLSLIWTYFEKRGLSKIENFFSNIKTAFSRYIWSKEELLIYKYTQYDLKENKFLAALKETFNLDFLSTLHQEHLNNFTTLTQSIESVSSELRKSLSEMDKSTSALQAQQNINKALIDFNVSMKSFEKTTHFFSTQFNNSLNRTFDKIDTEIGDIVIKLADFATHVSLESREVQDSIAKYHNMVANHVKPE